MFTASWCWKNINHVAYANNSNEWLTYDSCKSTRATSMNCDEDNGEQWSRTHHIKTKKLSSTFYIESRCNVECVSVSETVNGRRNFRSCWILAWSEFSKKLPPHRILRLPLAHRNKSIEISTIYHYHYHDEQSSFGAQSTVRNMCPKFANNYQWRIYVWLKRDDATAVVQFKNVQVHVLVHVHRPTNFYLAPLEKPRGYEIQ